MENFHFLYLQRWESSHRVKMDISWDGHWPKQASQTREVVHGDYQTSSVTPGGAQRLWPNLLIWFWWEQRVSALWRTGSISCASGSCGQQGFSRAVQSLRDLHFILFPLLTTELWSCEQQSPQSPAPGFKCSQLQTLPPGCLKHMYKSRDPAVPPDKSSCTLHVSWSSVDDAWENICERAEGLRDAILLSSKGQQQGLCWSFTQNLHHSQEGWTRYKGQRHRFFKG